MKRQHDRTYKNGTKQAGQEFQVRLGRRPLINEIQDKFSKKGLKIFGIEFTKFKGNGIVEYIEKHDIKYPVLHSGKLVKGWYGVQLAPTFYLIDKKGTIVYTSAGFDKEELVKAIQKNI